MVSGMPKASTKHMWHCKALAIYRVSCKHPVWRKIKQAMKKIPPPIKLTTFLEVFCTQCLKSKYWEVFCNSRAKTPLRGITPMKNNNIQQYNWYKIAWFSECPKHWQSAFDKTCDSCNSLSHKKVNIEKATTPGSWNLFTIPRAPFHCTKTHCLVSGWLS